MTHILPKISYEEFKKLDMRVGKICSVEILEGSDKLLVCQIDFGETEDADTSVLNETYSSEENALTDTIEIDTSKNVSADVTHEKKTKFRQIVSGIREFFPDYKNLEGKMALYVMNLEPREIRGVMSYGMLVAVDGVDGRPVFLIPENAVFPGSHVR